MNRIVSLTGPSGVGKTTIAGEVLRCIPDARMITSYTTRKKRPNDLPNEYAYLDMAEFARMHDRGEFLWTAFFDKTSYGTTAQSVRDLFEEDGTMGIMILMPSVVPLLEQFLRSIEKRTSYQPVFVAPPPDRVLEERLRARGDAEENIARRLAEAKDWFQDSFFASTSYAYVSNDDVIEDALNELRKTLRL